MPNRWMTEYEYKELVLRLHKQYKEMLEDSYNFTPFMSFSAFMQTYILASQVKK